jgi:hypothetical protein
MLISTEEMKSNRVNYSPSSLFERIELKTRFRDDIEDTVIMSVIDKVPIIILYQISSLPTRMKPPIEQHARPAMYL